MSCAGVRKTLILGLALTLLVVSGVASAQMVAHASQHAHHKASTHGTMVCVWMCAAGQVLAGAHIEVHAALTLIATGWADRPEAPIVEFRSAPCTRGPPTLIL